MQSEQTEPRETMLVDDVREMVRLIGEVAALPGGHAEKKRFLMQGICQLIGADAWVWGLLCERNPAKQQVYASIMNDGFTEESFVKWLEAIEHPEMIQLGAKFFTEVEDKQTHLTRLGTQLNEEAVFVQTKAHLAWKAADIGSLILSMRPLEGSTASTIAFYRRYEREKFSPRESRIAHIVLTEVPWLHEQGWPEDRGVKVPSLTKRQRLTLNLLIQGHSHKQIAKHMGISLHTVAEYIKSVYRHFGVKSHIELMSRFFQGNGRDL